MDPTANLAEIRTICAETPEDDRNRLVELVEALDEWLSKGGFLPQQWSRIALPRQRTS